MPLPRPSRPVRAASRDVSSLRPGLPCPKRQRGFSHSPALAPSEIAAAPAIEYVGASRWAMTLHVRDSCASAARSDEFESQKWVRLWAGLLEEFLPHAPNFVDLGGLAQPSLMRMLSKKAASTLRRHLPSWRLWLDFACHHEWPAYNPPLMDFVGYVQALLYNGKTARGAKNGIASLKFVAALMGWGAWLTTLGHSVVVAWCEPQASLSPRKEALPLPLSVVSAFETKIHKDLDSVVTKDTLALVAFLLMIWGALRFSDAQRLALGSCQIERGILRGWCYRTKTSKDGMPFGVLTLGIHDCWDKGVSHLCDHLGHGDFLIPGPSGARASFAYALGQFRKLLVAIGGLSTAQARNYTLHSLKTTGLTWALQLDVDHVQRRLWGHHRGGDSGSKMTTKYSRDDVLPALRAQLKVLDSVRGGWVPLTPQARGSLPPVPESALSGPLHRLVWTPLGLAAAGPGLDANDSGTETDTSSCSSSSSSEFCASDLEDVDAPAAAEPPALTMASGVFVVNSYFLLPRSCESWPG